MSVLKLTGQRKIDTYSYQFMFKGKRITLYLDVYNDATYNRSVHDISTLGLDYFDIPLPIREKHFNKFINKIITKNEQIKLMYLQCL